MHEYFVMMWPIYQSLSQQLRVLLWFFDIQISGLEFTVLLHFLFSFGQIQLISFCELQQGGLSFYIYRPVWYLSTVLGPYFKLNQCWGEGLFLPCTQGSCFCSLDFESLWPWVLGLYHTTVHACNESSSRSLTRVVTSNFIQHHSGRYWTGVFSI